MIAMSVYRSVCLFQNVTTPFFTFVGTVVASEERKDRVNQKLWRETTATVLLSALSTCRRLWSIENPDHNDDYFLWLPACIGQPLRLAPK